jgi:hypothetical protein
MQVAKVMAALIAIGCASAPVVQAQTRSPRSYSKVEIDKKIDQVRRDLMAKIPTRDTHRTMKASIVRSLSP